MCKLEKDADLFVRLCGFLLPSSVYPPPPLLCPLSLSIFFPVRFEFFLFPNTCPWVSEDGGDFKQLT